MAAISFLHADFMRDFKKGEEFFGTRQTDLPTFTQGSLPQPKTRVKIIQADESGFSFSVVQEGTTKNDTIRAYYPQLEEPIAYVEQWQPIVKFPGVYHKHTKEAALFCAAENRDLFLRRIAQCDMSLRPKPFDLQKLKDNQDFANIWGIWSEGDGGRISRKAIFGRNLGRSSEVETEEMTALDVEFEKPDGTNISLVISRDGRIFAMGKISNEDLYKIYEKIKPNLY
jgi:hypothetical protein